MVECLSDWFLTHARQCKTVKRDRQTGRYVGRQAGAMQGACKMHAENMQDACKQESCIIRQVESQKESDRRIDRHDCRKADM